MEIFPDFKELLALFRVHGVEYVIVGGYALAFHGAPRYTDDIDLLINPTPANAQRIVAALDAFGFASLGLTVQDFATPGQVVQLGMPPIRIDILTDIEAVSWEQANRGKIAGVYGEVPVHFICRRDLLANKKAVGRKQDLADVDALGDE
jgi:hypothetical protein